RPSQTRSVKRDRHSDTLVPPVIDNFCCPICKRKFCEKAYDRHAAFCASKTNRRIRFGSNRVSSTASPFIAKPISTSTASKQSIRNNSSFSLLSLDKKVPFLDYQ
ncbi:unnamed protein product, partial [Rotaria magnacalcarata]